MESAPADPFGVVVTADGRWSFAALPNNASVGVFRIGRSDLPALVRQVYLYLTGQPLGEVLTHDGRYLLAADDEDGALVISVGRAEAGQAAFADGTQTASTPGP